MGIAGLIFELHPPDFENDAKMIFDFFTGFRFSDFQRSVWSVPSISVAFLVLDAL